MPRRALISVSNKDGLEELLPLFREEEWIVYSTGGTARTLRDFGLEVTEVSKLTGFPEILGGRVKTLHPKVFAGILADASDEHRREMAEHSLEEINLVIVNLYPFRETVAKDGVDLKEAIEQIDIGGPSLLRAAAKNSARVVVIVDPSDYGKIEIALQNNQEAEGIRRSLALKVFRHTAAYDAAIAADLPELMGISRKSPTARAAEALLSSEEFELRYGENPHQWGVLASSRPSHGLAGAHQLQGKALSYNNLGDGSGAWRLVWDLPGPGVVVIKHANPCGVALGEDMVEAFRSARATDPISAFGGVVAANRAVDEDFAEAIVEQFTELVIAPEISQRALEVFSRKKNLRVLEAEPAATDGLILKNIDGGFLLQQADQGWDEEWTTVTEKKPSTVDEHALRLAWHVVKHVSSNAIVIGLADRILGIGAGQMSRVDAANFAVAKAREIGHDLEGAVAASDAFFPFPDGVEALAAAGVRAIIQPGGSIRDQSVIEACDRLGMVMLMTGRRHFRH